MTDITIDISFVAEEATLDSLEKELNSRFLHNNKTLERISKSFDHLHPNIQSTESKKKLMSLHGRLDQFKTNNEVDRIVEDSFALLSQKENFSEALLSDKADEIKRDIARFLYENAPSVSNRRFIQMAIYYLNLLQISSSSKTEDVLNSKAPFSNLKEDENMLPKFEQQTPLIDTEGWESAEFAFDLCEMAHIFYQNRINQGIEKLHQLTPSQKIRLKEICAKLGAKDPRELTALDTTKYRDELICFIRAIIGYANEVAQGVPPMFYPSEGEIHIIFKEVESFNSEC